MLSQTENIFCGPTNDGKERPAVLATVLYEDLEAGLRARGLMECVGANGDLALQFNLGLWRFDWLAEGSLGNVALGRANRSPLVLISASSANPLPIAAERWISAWIQNRQVRPAALVVLLPKSTQRGCWEHPLRHQLAEAARQKRVDFFCEFFEQPDANRGAGTTPANEAFGLIAAADFSGRTTATIARLLHRGTPGSRRAAESRLSRGGRSSITRNSAANSARATTTERTPLASFSAGHSTEIPITFRPAPTAADGEAHSTETRTREVLAGVAVAGLDARARRQFGLARGFQGACVTRIDTSSAAFKAGLRTGDVIQQMNPASAKIKLAAGFPVPMPDQSAVLLRVWSRGGSRLVAVTERITK